MGKVLVIFTGGTIASAFLGERKGPDASASRALHESISSFFAGKNMEVECLEPVSYTHLDVYKRQIQINK